MHLLIRASRWTLARLSALVVLVALASRVRAAWARRSRAQRSRRRAEREVLPSLFDRHPDAITAARRSIGLRSAPVEKIVGTMRHPSQNTADFLPLPRLRGKNWQARWQRINRAMDRLAMLPPVELVQVGDEYYVADGHNRVAAAQRAGAVEIDADVTQLLVPGMSAPGSARIDTSTLVGSDEVRQAAAGRHSRTVEYRDATDEVLRRDLLRGVEDPE